MMQGFVDDETPGLPSTARKNENVGGMIVPAQLRLVLESAEVHVDTRGGTRLGRQNVTQIAVSDKGRLTTLRDMGLVTPVFDEQKLRGLHGQVAIGHTRYSTAGSSVVANAQPIVVKTSMGPVGIVHNGNLVNPNEIRERLELDGSIFQTTSDTEVILHLMARSPRPDLVESFILALGEVRGAY